MTKSNSQLENFQPDGVQFFTPVSVGILVQLFCTGLVMAVTAAMTLSAAPRAVAVASGDAAETNTAREDSPEQPAPAAGGNDSGTTSGPDATVASGTTGQPGTTAQPATSGNAATPNTPQEPVDNSIVSLATNTPPSGVGAESTANGQSPNMPPAATSVDVNAARALDDVRKRGRKLPLAGEGLSDEIELCRIFTHDPATVSMELIGGEFTVPEQMTLVLKPLPITANSAVWKVAQESTTALSRDQEIGEFVLKDQQLRFRWFRNMDKGKLPFCRLRISVGPDSEICDLWAVTRSGAAKVRLTKSEQIMDEFVTRGIRLPPFEILELDLTLENWPEHEVSGDKLTFNETITVSFPDEDSSKDLMTLKFSLNKVDGHYALRGEYVFNAPELSSRGKGKDVRYHEEKLTEVQLKKTLDGLMASTAKIDRELDDVQQVLTTLTDTQAILMQQIANDGNNASRAKLQQVNNQIAAKSADETELEDMLDQLNAATSAMEKVSSLCEDIANEGQIQYRLFRPFAGDGGDVVIASTVTQAVPVEESR